MSLSIDGFVSDLEGTNKWMFGSDQESRAWAVEITWNASLHIMGSRRFLAMAAFWPTSTLEFAPPMNQIPKAVFPRQGPAILRNVNTTAALNGARANAGTGQSAEPQPGAGSWAEAYLVDQFVLGVHPVALGKGLPLFSELAAPRRFELVSSKAFPGGAVAQIYRPA